MHTKCCEIIATEFSARHVMPSPIKLCRKPYLGVKEANKRNCVVGLFNNQSPSFPTYFCLLWSVMRSSHLFFYANKYLISFPCSKFAWRMYSLGLNKEACMDFLRKQATDAGLSKGDFLCPHFSLCHYKLLVWNFWSIMNMLAWAARALTIRILEREIILVHFWSTLVSLRSHFLEGDRLRHWQSSGGRRLLWTRDQQIFLNQAEIIIESWRTRLEVMSIKPPCWQRCHVIEARSWRANRVSYGTWVCNFQGSSTWRNRRGAPAWTASFSCDLRNAEKGR